MMMIGGSSDVVTCSNEATGPSTSCPPHWPPCSLALLLESLNSPPPDLALFIAVA